MTEYNHTDKTVKWAPKNTGFPSLGRNGLVAARFAVASDLHLSENYHSSEKLRYAYKAIRCAGGVDAFILNGDSVNDGLPDQYDLFMDIVRENGDIQTVISMGNHEYKNFASYDEKKLFCEKTGQGLNGLCYINGIPVIKLSPSPDGRNFGTNSALYGDKEALLEGYYKTIDDSGYRGPVLLIAHHMLPDRKEGDGSWPESMISLISAHPKTVMFTAHEHFPVENIYYGIDQSRGFAQISCGTLSYTVDSRLFDAYTGRAKDGYTKENNGEYSGNIWYLDIMKNGMSELRLFSLAKGCFVYPGEHFIIDPENPGYFRSKDKGYGMLSRPPVFPENSDVSYRELPGKGMVSVSFPAASANSALACDMIYRYRLVFTDGDGASRSFDYLADFQDTGKAASWDCAVPGLKPGAPYSLDIYAVTGYGICSSPLSYKGTVTGAEPFVRTDPRLIYDIDYTSGDLEDRCHHRLIRKPDGYRTEKDERGTEALVFSGTGGMAYEITGDDYRELVSGGFTLDICFRYSGMYTQVILGNWYKANIGIKLENGTAYIWVDLLGNRNKRMYAPVEVPEGTWIRLTGIYDGRKIVSYLNGRPASEDEAYGDLAADIFDGTGEIYVGSAHEDEDGKLYPALNGTAVRYARIWSGTVSSDLLFGQCENRV